MMMKQITTILIFLLATIKCFGQKEHLEPARDFKQYEGVLREYYDHIFPLLYQGFADKPYAQYTSMPSFSDEYAFSIERIGNKNYVISNCLSENYWYAEKRDKVKLETKKTEIGDSLYIKIGKLFQLLTEQIKKPDQDLMGLDGVTYYFSCVEKNGEIKTGETWSPNDNSLLGRLIKICDKLYSLGNGKNISQSELEIEIEKTIIDMKE